MQEQMIRAGKQVINLGYVSGAKWDDRRLYVYLSGGRFMSFDGDEARIVWQVISSTAIDVMTGEVAAR